MLVLNILTPARSSSLPGRNNTKPLPIPDATGVNRLKRGQHARAFRFGNGNGICGTAFDDLAKFRFQELNPFEISRAISLNKILRLAAEAGYSKVGLSISFWLFYRDFVKAPRRGKALSNQALHNSRSRSGSKEQNRRKGIGHVFRKARQPVFVSKNV